MRGNVISSKHKERVSEVEKPKGGDIQGREGKDKELDQPFLRRRLKDFSMNQVFPGQPSRSR